LQDVWLKAIWAVFRKIEVVKLPFDICENNNLLNCQNLQEDTETEMLGILQPIFTRICLAGHQKIKNDFFECI
jgi:hypothetical protein